MSQSNRKNLGSQKNQNTPNNSWKTNSAPSRTKKFWHTVKNETEENNDKFNTPWKKHSEQLPVNRPLDKKKDHSEKNNQSNTSPRINSERLQRNKPWDIKNNNSEETLKKNNQGFKLFSQKNEKTHPIQVYALIYDDTNHMIIGQNSIISEWKVFVSKEDVSDPITSEDREIGLTKVDNLPYRGWMRFARNQPKQYTFIGGRANHQDITTSALSQMRQETGLVINDSKLCGFDSYEICNVLETNIVHYDHAKKIIQNERDTNHRYSILLIKVPENNLDEITKIINNNLTNLRTLDQELGNVEMVSFAKAIELLNTNITLNEKEFKEWRQVALNPQGSYDNKLGQRETFYPRNNQNINKALQPPMNDWLVKGIQDLQESVPVSKFELEI